MPQLRYWVIRAEEEHRAAPVPGTPGLPVAADHALSGTTARYQRLNLNEGVEGHRPGRQPRAIRAGAG